MHLLLDEKEEEEVEEYEEKELEEKLEEEEQEVYVSFKAESLSKRTLCLSSPGL